MKERGHFIVLEGTDGSGTTSIVNAVVNRMDKIVNIKKTCEPSDGIIGSLIREILSGKKNDIHQKAMAHLFIADRIQHVKNFIEPNLNNGITVICDRYYVSTLVYQSIIIGDALSSINEMKNIYREMVEFSSNELSKPDVTILLDGTFETTKNRREYRGGDPEIYDNDEYQKMVIDMYRRWWNENLSLGEEKYLINADDRFDDVLSRVMNIIDPFVI